LGLARSGIFLRARLDGANQLEVVGENRTLAQRRGTFDFDCLQQVGKARMSAATSSARRSAFSSLRGPKTTDPRVKCTQLIVHSTDFLDGITTRQAEKWIASSLRSSQ
jgi:hypothetical protein